MVTEPTAQSVEYKSCYARWNAQELVIGNAHLERRWRIEQGMLYAISLYDKDAAYEWVGAAAEYPSISPAVLPDEPRRVEIHASTGQPTPTENPSVQVCMTAVGASLELTYAFQVFPDASAISQQLSLNHPLAEQASNIDNAEGTSAPTGIETTPPPAADAQNGTMDIQDAFTLSAVHLRLTQVSFQDQTDVHNELVYEREWLLHPSERRHLLQGNLFVLEDTLAETGVVFLKQAPLPHARPVPETVDFSIHQGKQLKVVGHGMGDTGTIGYMTTVLTYRGGKAARTVALQRYQQQLRTYQPGRDGLFLTNTWGDRSRDSAVNEATILHEIAVAARMGADIVQIDDGWQGGRTANSAEAGGVWEGFWAADQEFWAPHSERFPRGLQPVLAAAHSHGMRIGLWFAPDSSDDFANWQRDADILLNLYRTCGVSYFKIDGVKARTKQGEHNLHCMFNYLLDASHGEIVFDFDITAEIRPGYFGLMGVGPLFVENRYTDWHNYWPHQTLRNLWTLAQYIDPRRLRMEFLNSARNTHLYADDPLAPACYTPDYLFATTMVANPLGWFEMRHLSDEYQQAVAQLVGVWRQHRERLFTQRILPIGAKPDGTAWTGFCALTDDDQQGYLLLFRELNPYDTWSGTLPLSTGRSYQCTALAGQGAVTVTQGTINAAIPQAQRYLFTDLRAI